MTIKAELMDETRAAKWLGVSISTLRRERQRGRLPFFRIGGWRICYSVDQLTNYLNDHCQPAARPHKKRERAVA